MIMAMPVGAAGAKGQLRCGVHGRTGLECRLFAWNDMRRVPGRGLGGEPLRSCSLPLLSFMVTAWTPRWRFDDKTDAGVSRINLGRSMA